MYFEIEGTESYGFQWSIWSLRQITLTSWGKQGSCLQYTQERELLQYVIGLIVLVNYKIFMSITD